MEIDWMQAELNGWSYCFHDGGDGKFCGRGERWPGHDGSGHDFMTLDEFLYDRSRPTTTCQSCGAHCHGDDDHRCLGCWLVVCQSCVDVFGHVEGGAHGQGDPRAAVESLRKERSQLLARVKELEEDRERLDWLAGSDFEVWENYEGNWYCDDGTTEPEDVTPHRSARQAIDAAREGE